MIRPLTLDELDYEESDGRSRRIAARTKHRKANRRAVVVQGYLQRVGRPQTLPAIAQGCGLTLAQAADAIRAAKKEGFIVTVRTAYMSPGVEYAVVR